MKSPWIRVLEVHSTAVSESDASNTLRGVAGVGSRIVAGAGVPVKSQEGSLGPAYVEVHVTDQGAARGAGGSECFKAQRMNLSDDDFLLLHESHVYTVGQMRGMSYIPWDRIVAIRFVSTRDA